MSILDTVTGWFKKPAETITMETAQQVIQQTYGQTFATLLTNQQAMFAQWQQNLLTERQMAQYRPQVEHRFNFRPGEVIVVPTLWEGTITPHGVFPFRQSKSVEITDFIDLEI